MTSDRKHKPRRWWQRLPATETDPITLEPLRKLKIEPFTLEEESHAYRFDGQMLAAFLVSSEQFVNPLTRRELELADCVRLDAHLAANGVKRQSVARAWELSKERGPNSERDALVAEARDVMRALFAGGSRPRGETLRVGLSEHAPAVQTGSAGVAVIDDDELRFAAPSQPARGEDERVEEAPASYPALEAPSARVEEPASVWAQRRAKTAPRSPPVAPAPVDAERPAREAEEAARSQRFRRLADAFGVSTDAVDAVRWPGELLAWAKATKDDGIGTEALRRLERRLAAVVDTGRPADLPAMRDARQRQRVREFVDFYCLSADEYEADLKAPNQKYLRVRKSRTRRFASRPRIPKPLLSQAAAGAVLPPPPKHQQTHKRHHKPAQHRRGAGQMPVKLEEAPPETAKTVWDAFDDDEDEDEPRAHAPATPPRYPYRQATTDECSICLLDIADDDVATLDCGHAFHTGCLADWHRTLENQPPAADEVRFDHVLQTTSCPHCRQSHTVSAVQLPADRW